jgi:hypothetical protein
VNAIALRFSATLLVLASLSFTGEARAQLRTPPTVKVPQKEMRPSPAPNALYEQLTRQDPNSQFLEQRIDALDILAIGGSELQDVRLTYEDLDGDGIPEALFTVEVPGNNVSLAVLKRKGNQWYRLASPEEFSCWCKYEDSPLDSFAEIHPWGYGKDTLAKLLFIRASGGGTGLYVRGLHVYALLGFEVKEVFHIGEERRECGNREPIECDINHTEILPVDDPDQPRALLALSYERKHFGGDFGNDTWWIGLPIHTCAAYIWNAQRQQFLENRSASLAYCGHLGTRPPAASTPTR